MKKFIILLFVVVSVLTAHAQQLGAILARADSVFSFEKIYLQYDKQHYLSGETIFCKAFIRNGPGMAVGTSLKLQVLNGKGIPLLEKVYPVMDGAAVGSIDLPDTLPTGRYFLKAFTDLTVQTKNEARSFLQPFVIFNPVRTNNLAPAPYKRIVSTNLSSAFAPIVTGMLNEISFTVSDQYHYPVTADVYLLNEKKDTLCISQSSEWGAGKLLFTPEKGIKYQVIVVDGTDTHSYPLPEATEGVALSATALSDQYLINIRQSDLNNKMPAWLIGESSFAAVFTIALNGREKLTTIRLPKDSLPEGIMRLVVADSTLDMLNETLVFVHNQSLPSNQLNKQSIAAKELNDTMLVSTTKPVVQEAVVAGSIVNEAKEWRSFYPKQNIASRMLFSSYFDHPLPVIPALFGRMNVSSLAILDIILAADRTMLPTWSKLKTATVVPDKKRLPGYIHFAGQVTRANKKPLAAKDSVINLVIRMADSSTSYRSLVLSKDGYFSDEGLLFFDSARCYYQTGQDKADPSKQVDIKTKRIDKALRFEKPDMTLYNAFPDIMVVKDTVAGGGLTETQPKPLQDTAIKSSTLQGVTVTGTLTLRQKTKMLEKRYTRGLFEKDASKVLDLVNDPYPNGGMSVYDYINMVYTNILEMPTPRTPKVFYVNEGLVQRDDLKTISIQTVALVKIYQNSISPAFAPAVAVYLKRAEDLPPLRPTGLQNSFVLKGYDTGKEFLLSKANQRSDKMCTIYWNPILQLEAGKPLQLSFNKTQHLVGDESFLQLEGIAADGNIVYYRKKLGN